MLRLITFIFSMTLAAIVTTAKAENLAITVAGNSTIASNSTVASDSTVAGDSACAKAEGAGQTVRSVSMFYPKPDMSGVGVSSTQSSNSLPGAQVTVPQKVSRKTEAAAVAAGLVVEGIAKELNPDILTPHDRAVAPPFGVAR